MRDVNATVGSVVGSIVTPCDPRFRPPCAITALPCGEPIVACTHVAALSVSTTWKLVLWLPVVELAGPVVMFAGDGRGGRGLGFVCPVFVLYGAVGGDGNRSASTTSTDTATIAARAIITRLDSRRCRRRCGGRDRGREAIGGCSTAARGSW